METLTNKIQNQIMKVINKAIFKEKKKIFKVKGISLYPSELHLIMVIIKDIDTNATQIAKRLGVTKGAICQTLSRLERKGIILKTKDPYNKNELTLFLTDFGKEVYELYKSNQTLSIEAHKRYLSKLNSKEKEVVLNFLLEMEKVIDELELP